jgi:hypothetical protein
MNKIKFQICPSCSLRLAGNAVGNEKQNLLHKGYIFLKYELTTWSRVILEKPIGLQLAKKFPAFHETRRFITAFLAFCDRIPNDILGSVFLQLLANNDEVIHRSR